MPPEAGLKTLVGLKGDKIWAIAAGATCMIMTSLSSEAVSNSSPAIVTSTYEQTIVNLPPLMIE